MSAHVRQQLRKLGATNIRQGVPLFEGRVEATRVYPRREFPACTVWTLIETVLDEAAVFGDASIQFRELQLIVDILEKSAKDFFPDDKLDNLCAQVEPIISADPTWGGLAHTTEYLQTEFLWDAETEQPAGRARMTWRIVFRVSTSDPTIPLS